MYERLLREAGHTVCFAPSALGALDMLRIEAKAIDLVLLDVRLGATMSGVEVARQLRGVPPVIVVTGIPLDELRRDPLEFVARTFRKADFEPGALLDAVDELTGEHRQ
jgi:CheY-like chemotaxis protein